MSTLLLLLAVLYQTTSVTNALGVQAQLKYHQIIEDCKSGAPLPGAPMTPRTAKRTTRIRIKSPRAASHADLASRLQLLAQNKSSHRTKDKDAILPMLHDFIWSDDDRILEKISSQILNPQLGSLSNFIPTNKSLSEAIVLSNQRLLDKQEVNSKTQQKNSRKSSMTASSRNPLSKPSLSSGKSKAAVSQKSMWEAGMSDILSMSADGLSSPPETVKSSSSQESTKSSLYQAQVKPFKESETVNKTRLKRSNSTSSIRSVGSGGSAVSVESGRHSALMVKVRKDLELNMARSKIESTDIIDLPGYVLPSINPMDPANLRIMDIINQNHDNVHQNQLPPRLQEHVDEYIRTRDMDPMENTRKCLALSRRALIFYAFGMIAATIGVLYENYWK